MYRKAVIVVALLAMSSACDRDAATPGPSPEEAGRTAAVPKEQPAAVADPSSDTTPLLLRDDGEHGHLVDSSGSALYYLEENQEGRLCDMACQQVWPPVISRTPDPAVSPELELSAVSTFPSEQDGYHVTYHGHPLYRYAGDLGARTTSGQSVKDEWGQWHLMGADGERAAPSEEKNGPSE